MSVGVFGIGLAAYWPQFDGLKERVEGYQRRVEERVAELGGDVISAGLVDSEQAGREAGDRFAAARYLSTSPQKGKVKLTGLGFPNQMRKFVKDGTVEEFQLWVPKDVGYLAGQAAAALVAGRITGKEGEKFEAGRLGEYTIGANGEIVLGPLTTFNADNIDDFDF